MALIRVKLPFSQRWESLLMDFLKWFTVYITVTLMAGSTEKFVKSDTGVSLVYVFFGLLAYHIVVLEFLEFEFTE